MHSKIKLAYWSGCLIWNPIKIPHVNRSPTNDSFISYYSIVSLLVINFPFRKCIVQLLTKKSNWIITFMTTVIPYSELNKIPVWNPMSNGTIISKMILMMKTIISHINLPFEWGWISCIFDNKFSMMLPNMLIVAFKVDDNFNMKLIHSFGI